MCCLRLDQHLYLHPTISHTTFPCSTYTTTQLCMGAHRGGGHKRRCSPPLELKKYLHIGGPFSTFYHVERFFLLMGSLLGLPPLTKFLHAPLPSCPLHVYTHIQADHRFTHNMSRNATSFS